MFRISPVFAVVSNRPGGYHTLSGCDADQNVPHPFFTQAPAASQGPPLIPATPTHIQRMPGESFGVPNAMPVVPLEMLSAGEQGRIHDVDGSTAFVHRLEEMGLRVGAVVCMVQPGSPCILAVGNHRFSLRMEETATVLVEVGA